MDTKSMENKPEGLVEENSLKQEENRQEKVEEQQDLPVTQKQTEVEKEKESQINEISSKSNTGISIKDEKQEKDCIAKDDKQKQVIEDISSVNIEKKDGKEEQIGKDNQIGDKAIDEDNRNQHRIDHPEETQNNQENEKHIENEDKNMNVTVLANQQEDNQIINQNNVNQLKEDKDLKQNNVQQQQVTSKVQQENEEDSGEKNKRITGEQKSQSGDQNLDVKEEERKEETIDEGKDIVIQEILLLQDEFLRCSSECTLLEQRNKETVEEINEFYNRISNLTEQIRRLDPNLISQFNQRMSQFKQA